MKQTAMQEANEKYLKLSSEEFYGWFWNNRERLLELEKEQIIEAHGAKQKLKSNPGSIVTYSYWFNGEDYYEKTFENKPK